MHQYRYCLQLYSPEDPWHILINIVELLFVQGYWNPHTHKDPRLATTEFPHPHLSEARNIVRISWNQHFLHNPPFLSGELSIRAASVDVGGAEAEGVALSFSKGGGGKAGRPQARGRPVLNSLNFCKSSSDDPFQLFRLAKWLLLWRRPLPYWMLPGSWPSPSSTLFSDTQRLTMLYRKFKKLLSWG